MQITKAILEKLFEKQKHFTIINYCFNNEEDKKELEKIKIEDFVDSAHKYIITKNIFKMHHYSILWEILDESEKEENND